MDRCACACGESVVRRGGVNLRPRASITQSPLSSSARSMGVMRTILPSWTSTKTGPPVVQFVSRWTSPILVRPRFQDATWRPTEAAGVPPNADSSAMRTRSPASWASYRRATASQARPPLRPAAPHELHSILAMAPLQTDREPVRFGVLLAGGESRRMGRDKRGLRLGGETLLQRNLAFLERPLPRWSACRVRSADQAPADLPAGRRRDPRRGAGLAAGRSRLDPRPVR